MRMNPATALRSAETAEELTATDWSLGPGSVSWEVLRNPVVYVIALLREGILLTLHPPFAAAATDHDRVHQDPVMRYRTVARYAYSVVYGTREEAARVSGFVRKNHQRVVGIEPLSGQPYQAHSDYELALTQVLLTSSWIAAYEIVHGRLPDADRDQFLIEQKSAGALLEIPPDHLPSTMAQLEAFLAQARERFAVGPQAREVLKPFAYGDYPFGSVIGELSPLRRKAVASIVRGLTDMTLVTMHPGDLDLLSIGRRPELRFRAATRASVRPLAAYLGSERGTAQWERFMKPDLAAIMDRARAAERAAGGHRAAAAGFVPPDPAGCLVDIEGRVANMPPQVLAAMRAA